jgi:hypothetical protein
MVAEELKIVIKADSKRAHKSLRGIEQQTQKTTKSMASMKKLLVRGLGFAAAAVSVGALTKAMRASVEAYGQQVTAERTLAGAIEATGENAEELLPRYKALASEIQSVTTVGDESTLALMQQAQSMGISSDKMEEATKGAIGLSKAFGIGTQQAIKGVANAMQGNFQTLQRYIPALRTTEDEGEKMAIVQKAMADGFKVAESEAGSAYGEIKQLSNSFGDLQEEIGESLSKGMQPFTSALKTLVENATNAVSAMNDLNEVTNTFTGVADKDAIAALGLEALEKTLESARARMETFYKRGTDGAIRQAEQIRNNVIPAIEEQIRAAQEEQGRAEARNKIIDKYNSMAENAKELAKQRAKEEEKIAQEMEKQRSIAQEMNKTAAEKREEIRKEYGRELELLNASSDKERERMRLEFERADALAAARKEYVKTGEEVQLINEYFDAKIENLMKEKELTQDQIDMENDLYLIRLNGSQEYIENLIRQEQLTENVKNATDQLTDAVANDLKNGFASSFAAMGEAAVNGEDVMKAFGKSVVFMFADMLKSIGQYLTMMAVAYGIALMWGKSASAIAGAAAAYTASGAVRAAAKNMRSGGIIQEEVVGTGQSTGKTYRIGESGPEKVTPMTGQSEGGGAGGDVYLDGEKVGKWLNRRMRSKRQLIPREAIV